MVMWLVKSRKILLVEGQSEFIKLLQRNCTSHSRKGRYNAILEGFMEWENFETSITSTIFIHK
jgi:hypothetical protein